jgi:hypothetical protein
MTNITEMCHLFDEFTDAIVTVSFASIKNNL